MYLHEIEPGTPEADALARKILTNLAEIYARYCGYELGEISFETKRKGEDNDAQDKEAPV